MWLIRHSLQQASKLTAGKPGQLATFLCVYPVRLTWSSLRYGCFRWAKIIISKYAEKDATNPVQQERSKPGNSQGRAGGGTHLHQRGCWWTKKEDWIFRVGWQKLRKGLGFQDKKEPAKLRTHKRIAQGRRRWGQPSPQAPSQQDRNPWVKCFRRSRSVYSRWCWKVSWRKTAINRPGKKKMASFHKVPFKVVFPVTWRVNV